MTTEATTTRLIPDSQLLLDQSLLKLPHELVRRNFKNVQRYVDREREHILPALKETANATMTASPSPEQTLANLDAMISRMQAFKRKLENLQIEEAALHDDSAKRLRHLQELYDIPSLSDTRYETWSRTRLDRLTVDYLLRHGYSQTAKALAEAKDITHLIDLDTFVSCHKIAASIARGETKDALTWINENRNALKKLPQMSTSIPSSSATPQSSNLEFELRLQQFVELIRAAPDQKKMDAISHARKYIIPHSTTRPDAIMTVAGLLAQTPSTISQPYSTYFSPSRWEHLSQLFITTHHTLLSLPTQPLLHTALSAGLSALKTPACHSVHNPASSSSSSHPRIASNTSLCPICSTELNELARAVPYAHHTTSYVESDAVVLPNNRIYGRRHLEDLQRKILRAHGGVTRGKDGDGNDRTHPAAVSMVVDESMIGTAGEVTDPTTGESFAWEEVKKVYIT